MSMMHTNQRGYILTFTLALIALFMFLATYVSNKGLVFNSYTKTMVDREKARILAYGGIQLAISQLVTVPAKQEAPVSGPQEKKAEQPSDGKQLLKVILPQINRLQKYELKQNIEGINATVGFMLMSEEGKININRFYDFDKHKFLGDEQGAKAEAQPEKNMRTLFQQLFAQIKEQTNADLFAEFEKFLKERKYPLNDVTELLTVKGFDVFKDSAYVDPLATDQKKPKVYLTDIFTVSSSKQSIEPWLISNSLASLLKLQRDPAKVPPVDELLKSFKDKSDWKTDWDKSLKNWYGVEFAALPKFANQLLNPVFDPKMFSVFVFATVGTVTVRLIALLEREKQEKDAPAIVHIRSVYVI